MTHGLAWLTVAVLLGYTSATVSAGAAPCTTTSEVKISADADEKDATFQSAANDVVGTCDTDPGFVILDSGCEADAVQSAVTLAGAPFEATAILVVCKGGKLTVTLKRDKLTPAEEKELTLRVTRVTPLLNFSAKATIPKRQPVNDAPANDPPPSPVLTPQNAEDAAVLREQMLGCVGDHTKCIYVHENLAIDPRSARYVTDTDRIVVRLIARNAVRCLYQVQSDADNKTEREAFRVGGGDSISAVLKEAGILMTAARATDKTEEKELLSCGFPVTLTKNGDYKVTDTTSAKYGHTDFTFGPYSNPTVKFLASRYDRTLKTIELKEVTLQVENHRRYAGWLDLGVFGLQVQGDKLHVDKENGSELQRIRIEDGRSDIDFAVLVKFFLGCSGAGNGWGSPHDLSMAGVCLGLSGGFSLTQPTTRFFPAGLNLTFGGKVSVHGLLVLERGKVLTNGLADGDLFSGSVDDLTTNTELQWGYAVGVALDPTIVGDFFGTIIKAM